MEKDTICAISTPIGTGGISIVRVSGDKAKDIAFKIFHSKSLTIKNIKPRYMYLGGINSDNFYEKCIMVYFEGPNSYTGEDIVEFQCHGGVLVTRKLLELLLANGARLAEGGEFSKRAFVNGKMSLDQAEGVIDTINAESDSELKASSGLVKGYLNEQIAEIQNILTDVISKINVTFDFPENDDEEVTSVEIKSDLEQVKQKLNKLIQSSKTGLKLKTGNRIVIVGKPNVGKSSIMNAMLGTDRAIVTDIQGTTRDILEETYIFGGVKFVLTDTAGIHDSKDVIENIGINKAKESLKQADVVLIVLDGSQALTEYDKQLFELIDNKNVLVVINKSDLKQKINTQDIPFDNILVCSALLADGIDIIKQNIFDMVIDNKILNQNVIITNVRHSEILNKSSKLLSKIIKDLDEQSSLELIALNLQELWATLGEITGVSNTEEIITNIFNKFCVGK